MKSEELKLSPKVKTVFDHILSQGLTFGEMDELLSNLTRWTMHALVENLEQKGEEKRGDGK